MTEERCPHGVHETATTKCRECIRERARSRLEQGRPPKV